MTTAPHGSPRLAAPFLALLVGMQLAGCAFLPSAGPGKGDIDDQARSAQQQPFNLIDIDGDSLAAEQARPQPGFAEHFGTGGADGQKAPAALVRVGDGVAIDIWETGTDPLFSPRSASPSTGGAGRNAGLPEQLVGADGGVSVPFAGRMIVAGRSQVEIEQMLTQALAGKAARAQVIVRVRNLAGTVTVAGDVAAGARVSLSVQGERVLDVLAAAGGVRAPTHETRIQLTRGADSFELPLLQLLRDPRQNIFLQPGDLLVATRQPKSFTAFGATGRNAQIEFGSDKISLIEAVAKTGGLLDSRADPRGVYLLRYEPRALLQSLGKDAAPLAGEGDEVRVVYRLDLALAGSYFLAQRFQMRDRDIVYVSSAPTGQLQKFLELVGLISQPIIQGAVVRQAVQ